MAFASIYITVSNTSWPSLFPFFLGNDRTTMAALRLNLKQRCTFYFMDRTSKRSLPMKIPAHFSFYWVSGQLVCLLPVPLNLGLR